MTTTTLNLPKPIKQWNVNDWIEYYGGEAGAIPELLQDYTHLLRQKTSGILSTSGENRLTAVKHIIEQALVDVAELNSEH